MRALLFGLAVWIFASNPAFAALCEPPSRVGLLNARWPSGKEISVRLGGYQAGAREKAEKTLSPLLAYFFDELSSPWRFVDTGEAAKLTIVLYRPAIRRASADVAIEEFFADDFEKREAFVADLTGDIQMRVLPGKLDIDFSAAKGETIEINLPKLLASAPRIVASPVPDTEDATLLIMLRALMLALAGSNDVLSAVECDDYEGIMTSTTSLKLSDDDLRLLRGK